MIEISKICIDGRLQSRAALDQNVVADYAEAYRAAVKMPPVVLFFDGSTYWLADGFHRYNGAKDAGLAQIHEEIIPGTLREAILYSVRANEAHGLRRTNADKRKAVQTLLDDAEWAAWSSNAIAKACGVGDHLVADIRKSYLRENEDAPIIRKVERDGVAYEQNTAKIGKKKAESLPPNSDRDESCDTAQPDNGAPFSAEQNELVDNYELEEANEAIRSLAAENEQLKDRMATGSTDEPEEAKERVLRTIEELREHVRCLEIENAAIKSSRDYFQSENAELKKQVAYWRKQSEKAA